MERFKHGVEAGREITEGEKCKIMRSKQLMKLTNLHILLTILIIDGWWSQLRGGGGRGKEGDVKEICTQCKNNLPVYSLLICHLSYVNIKINVPLFK